jgi:hypothetical protein
MAISKTSQTEPTRTHLSESNNPPMGSVTSSFLVEMDKILYGNITDYPQAVALLWYTSTEERTSIGSMSSDYQASATLIHTLLEMHIMTDSSMPTLRENLRNNTRIETITITRLGHLNGVENTEMYTSIFSDCYLEAIEEFPDKVIVKARVTSREDTAMATDFTGKQGGKTVSGWDYSTNKPILQ